MTCSLLSRRWSILTIIALVALVVLPDCRQPERDADGNGEPVLGNGIQVDPEWATHAREIGVEVDPLPLDLANTRSTTASPITAANADALEPRWQFETAGNVTGRPAYDDGVVYFGDWSGRAYALNVFDGTERWNTQLVEPRSERPWYGVVGGPAVDDQRVYIPTAEGEVWSVNKRSGEPIWHIRVTANPNAGPIGDVLAHNGNVFVGLASIEPLLHGNPEGFEPSFRGRLMSLDAETGEVNWMVDLAQPPHNGVAIWSSLAIDPNLNTVFFTTGYNYTGRASHTSDAIGAIDADSGEIRWVTQLTQHDVWTMHEPTGPGYAFAAGPQLFTTVINGERRALVGAGQKSGTFWALDRATGQVVWHNTVGYGQIGGGIMGEAGVTMDTIFVWSNNSFKHADPQDHPMNVAALDAATGRTNWHRRNVQPASTNAGAFVVNDLFLVPSLDGHVRGYRTADGERVWESQAHGSVGGSIGVVRDMIIFGTGVPQAFGGTGDTTGLIAYGLRD